MKCKQCGKNHPIGTPHPLHLVEKLSDKGFPTHAKKYKEAHEQADKLEKKKFPKGYQEMKKKDLTLNKHELAGKNTKNGKLEVSKKVPPKLRKEVAYHEEVENKILRKKK